MWTDATREKHEQSGLRCESDLTDAGWAVLEALLAPPSSLGRPRKTDLREVMRAILYIARSGYQWRRPPGEFPPRGTVQYYFYKWRVDGTWHEANRALLAHTREVERRAAGATAGVIDSQAVRTTESGSPRGSNAGKKLKGCKRHIVTDTGGLLLTAQVHATDIQDRDGAPGVFAAIRHAFPTLRHVFADGAYAGLKLEGELKRIGRWTL